MPTRTSEATWEGKIREGSGSVELGSGAFSGSYSFASRFEDAEGTNPDELVAAAHAGCFSLAFSGSLTKAGYDPERIHTKAHVHLDADSLTIDRIRLEVEAEVPGIEEDEFLELATDAKENCPVSKALAGPEIEMDATLL